MSREIRPRKWQLSRGGLNPNTVRTEKTYPTLRNSKQFVPQNRGPVLKGLKAGMYPTAVPPVVKNASPPCEMNVEVEKLRHVVHEDPQLVLGDAVHRLDRLDAASARAGQVGGEADRRAGWRNLIGRQNLPRL